MTTDEIKRYIQKKIAGQGNQVDMGGALPTILNFLLDGLDGKASLREFNEVADFLDRRKAEKIECASTRIDGIHQISPDRYIYADNVVTSFVLRLYPPEEDRYLHFHMITFKCGADPAITLPDSIKWNTEPMFEEGKTYEIIIIRGLYGTINVWE